MDREALAAELAALAQMGDTIREGFDAVAHAHRRFLAMDKHIQKRGKKLRRWFGPLSRRLERAIATLEPTPPTNKESSPQD